MVSLSFDRQQTRSHPAQQSPGFLSYLQISNAVQQRLSLTPSKVRESEEGLSWLNSSTKRGNQVSKGGDNLCHKSDSALFIALTDSPSEVMRTRSSR